MEYGKNAVVVLVLFIYTIMLADRDLGCDSASSEFEVSRIAEFNRNVAIDLNSDIDANCRCREIQR
jgi:hypothetical protein